MYLRVDNILHTLLHTRNSRITKKKNLTHKREINVWCFDFGLDFFQLDSDALSSLCMRTFVDLSSGTIFIQKKLQLPSNWMFGCMTESSQKATFSIPTTSTFFHGATLINFFVHLSISYKVFAVSWFVIHEYNKIKS